MQHDHDVEGLVRENAYLRELNAELTERINTAQRNDRPPRLSEEVQDIFSLPEGQVVLKWPAVLSPDGFDDLSAWLDLVRRKIGRSVKAGDSGSLTDARSLDCGDFRADAQIEGAAPGPAEKPRRRD